MREESRALLEAGEYDAAFVIAAGLSAAAVHRHAAPLLSKEDWRIAPLTVVLQGRVAVGDEIGARLGAKQVAVLIGERPGLTSPDSLGWAAQKLHLLMREAGTAADRRRAEGRRSGD